MERQEIKELIRQMEDLPTLPSVAVKIINTLLDERSSAADVAEVVGVDHSLTMKVLMVANSAFYGVAREVSTVRQAIVALGFGKLKSIILSLSVLDTVEAMAEESESDASEFWTHSLMCAVCTEAIASTLGEEFSEEIFVAGLLHDIGKLVLSHQMPSAFKQAVEMAQRENISTVGAEQVTMHMDHAIVGECIMEQWQFPSSLRESVGQHHDPPLRYIASDVSIRMAAIVCLADILCNMRNVGFTQSGELARVEEIRKHLGLPKVDIEEISDRLDDQVGEISKALGLETVPRETYFEMLQRVNAELGRMSLLVQEGEQRYRGVFESIQDVYLEVRIDDGRILEISPSIEQLSGYRPEEILGRSIFSLYARPETHRELLQALKKTGSIRDYEVRIVDKQGKEVPCSWSARAVADEAGTPPKIAGTLRDITERTHVREMLREREARRAGIEILRQTLATLSRYIYNAVAIIAQRMDAAGDHEELIETNSHQIKRISTVLGALDKMIKEMDVQTATYVGLQDAIRDIEEELKRTLGES